MHTSVSVLSSQFGPSLCSFFPGTQVMTDKACFRFSVKMSDSHYTATSKNSRRKYFPSDGICHVRGIRRNKYPCLRMYLRPTHKILCSSWYPFCWHPKISRVNEKITACDECVSHWKKLVSRQVYVHLEMCVSGVCLRDQWSPQSFA